MTFEVKFTMLSVPVVLSLTHRQPAVLLHGEAVVKARDCGSEKEAAPLLQVADDPMPGL